MCLYKQNCDKLVTIVRVMLRHLDYIGYVYLKLYNVWGADSLEVNFNNSYIEDTIIESDCNFTIDVHAGISMCLHNINDPTQQKMVENKEGDDINEMVVETKIVKYSTISYLDEEYKKQDLKK